jgi:exosortase C (VPDSG-CTERM-specific)
MNSPQDRDVIKSGQSAVPMAKSYASLKRFALLAGGLVILFIKPLYDLVRYAMGEELYSHILLIPFVSFYFLWQQKEHLTGEIKSSRTALFPLVAGFIALGYYWFSINGTIPFNQNDYLTATIFAFVSFLFAICLFLFGKKFSDGLAFPMLFLFFMVPFPTFFTDGVEKFFQYSSAEASYAMLQLSNAPVFRHGLEFRLPGIVIHVAPECSGIRSTLVLFITSIIAGHLFLQSTWKKVVLTLFVIPLAILRNGFRIFIIAQLCIHRGPEMIHSEIHRRGGPIFFLISLVPFFVLLFFLRKSKLTKPQSVSL